ncbi:MAG: CBS domain-containing protein [Nitrospiraceae bacterium]|nr:MAG: CBS domain-containing protein [Nitrospiraceae bacterium]
MKDIPGYIDITPGDFKEIYQLASRHALKRAAESVKAKDVMTRKVFSVKRSTPVEDVADLLALNGISGAPVIDDDGKVAGIISEKDFLTRLGIKDTGTVMGMIARCLKNKGCMIVSIKTGKAEDIMSSPAITVSEDITIQEIARIFTEKNINRVPVTDSNGHLAGIVSRADIVRYVPAQYKE